MKSQIEGQKAFKEELLKQATWTVYLAESLTSSDDAYKLWEKVPANLKEARAKLLNGHLNIMYGKNGPKFFHDIPTI